MSARKSLLLVDADSRSLRVLEVSLRKVGYTVRTAETAASALQSALTSPPDLVVTETRLPDYDGFELGRRLRQDPRTHHTLLVFLTEGATPELKVRGIDVGADEFLTKPVLVKEVISRIRTLLDRRDAEGMQPDPGMGISGTLANMGVVDLLQVMEAGDKSGTAKLASDPVRSGGYVEGRREQGLIFFRDGQVVDAELGRLRGQDAVYRMMLWEDGLFEVEFGDVARVDEIGKPTQALLLEGLKIVDVWSQYADRIPALQSRLRADLQVASKKGPLPQEVQQILALFDGRRTLFEVVTHSALPQQTVLRILSALNEQGALQLADESMGDVEALESWLDEPVAEPAHDDGLDLPSALEQAVIPSPESPSEILAAYDPTTSQSSQPLLRQTLSASYVGPLPSRAPEPSVGRRRPMLRVHKVGSTIDQLPTLSDAPPVSRGSAPPPAPARSQSWPSATPVPAPARASAQPAASRNDLGAPVAQPQPPIPEPAAPTPTPMAERTLAQMPPADDAPFGPSGPMAGGSASERVDQRAVDTQELPRTPSLADQTAALANAPAAYTPSEASTFKDDFFKGDEATPPPPSYGPPPWVVAAMVIAVVFGLVFVIANQRGEGTAEEPEQAAAQTEEPEAEDPEAKARAAMAAAAAESEEGETTEAEALGAADEEGEEAEDDGQVAEGEGQAEEEDGASTEAAAAAAPPETEKPEKKAAEKKAPAEPKREAVAQAPSEPSGPSPRNEARKLVRSGDAALEQGQLADAESRYRQALELNGRNAAAQSGLAFVHMERAEDDQARTMARNALRIDRRQARAHLVLGLIAFNRNDRDEARKSYEAYLALAPNGRHAPDVRAALENLR